MSTNTWALLIVAILILILVVPMIRVGEVATADETFAGHGSYGLIQRGAPPTILHF